MTMHGQYFVMPERCSARTDTCVPPCFHAKCKTTRNIQEKTEDV